MVRWVLGMVVSAGLVTAPALAEDCARVTMDFKNAPVVDVLKLVAEMEQVQLEVSPLVKGKVTLSLVNIRTRDAWGEVARAGKLDIQRHGKRVVVKPMGSGVGTAAMENPWASGCKEQKLPVPVAP